MVGRLRLRVMVGLGAVAAAVAVMFAGSARVTGGQPAAPALAEAASTSGIRVSGGCTPAWSIVPSPQSGLDDAGLLGVTAISATDAWAVGYRRGFRTLVEHWNGEVWRVIPSPNIPLAANSKGNMLRAVAARSPQDVWAVGEALPYALVEHWDGMRWRATKIPPILQGTATLRGVVAVAPHDVWAVGQTGMTPARPMVAHWNGRTWEARLPFPSLPGTLVAVDALSARDVWAMGWSRRVGVLAAHWNGHTWKTVRFPPFRTGLEVSGLAAVSPRELWAINGEAILRWDGRRSLTVFRRRGYWAAIAARTAGDIWAVGWENVLHWNGRQWKPVLPSASANLEAVALAPDGTGWAVGHTWDGERTRPVIARLACSS